MRSFKVSILAALLAGCGVPDQGPAVKPAPDMAHTSILNLTPQVRAYLNFNGTSIRDSANVNGRVLVLSFPSPGVYRLNIPGLTMDGVTLVTPQNPGTIQCGARVVDTELVEVGCMVSSTQVPANTGFNLLYVR